MKDFELLRRGGRVSGCKSLSCPELFFSSLLRTLEIRAPGGESEHVLEKVRVAFILLHSAVCPCGSGICTVNTPPVRDGCGKGIFGISFLYSCQLSSRGKKIILGLYFFVYSSQPCWSHPSIHSVIHSLFHSSIHSVPTYCAPAEHQTLLDFGSGTLAQPWLSMSETSPCSRGASVGLSFLLQTVVSSLLFSPSFNGHSGVLCFPGADQDPRSCPRAQFTLRPVANLKHDHCLEGR